MVPPTVPVIETLPSAEPAHSLSKFAILGSQLEVTIRKELHCWAGYSAIQVQDSQSRKRWLAKLVGGSRLPSQMRAHSKPGPKSRPPQEI
jgi:hypothetical protein